MPTCPSLCTTYASMETSWTTTCWLLLMGNFVPPSAPPSVVTCQITLGGKLPQRLLAAALAFARPLACLCWPSSPAASCLAPWSPPQSITFAWPLILRATDEALSRFFSTAAAQELFAQLDEALSKRELLWRNRDLPTPSPRHARGITPDDGNGDDKHPLARKRLKVQGVITACVYTGVQEDLLQMHEGEGSWAAHTWLAELGCVDVDHTWLWRLTPHHGPTLEPEEHVDSVRLRSGCARSTEPLHCAACQSCLLDSGAAHATCCALEGPHVATMRSPLSSTLLRSLAITLLRWKSLVSFLAQTQRPADVLTSALCNVCTALDISICSPHAQQAGPDCTRSWLVAKLDYHGRHLPSLLRQTISYTPIVWSACGDTLSPGQFCGMRGELCEALLSRRDTASPDRPTMLSTLCAALSFFSGPCEPLVQAGPLCSATSLTVAHDHVCCLDLLHVVQFLFDGDMRGASLLLR